jgi:hypothetical protein
VGGGDGKKKLIIFEEIMHGECPESKDTKVLNMYNTFHLPK